jgi:hypothetical protein
MSNEPARFASAIFVGALVALSSTTVSFGATQASETCLSEPNGEAPAGKHWYYHIERGTGRHCWYVRGEDDKPVRAETSESAQTKEKSPRTETEAVRSIADAHAELPLRTGIETTAAAVPPSAAPAPADVTGSVPASAAAPPLRAASPWPAPSSLAQPAQSAMAAADEPAASQAAPVPGPPVAQPAPVIERNIGSLQKLLLVAFCALALAGLTGSVVYRSAAGARRRARRKDRWPKKAIPRVVPRAVPETTAKASRTTAMKISRELADDALQLHRVAPKVDGSISQPIAADAGDESEYPNDRVERIEDFLARLTKQLQVEMESSRAR